MKKNKIFVLVLAAVLAAVLSPLAHAARPDRQPASWAFANKSFLAHDPVARFLISGVTPDAASNAIGKKLVSGPSKAPPTSAALRSEVMVPTPDGAARVVVDMTSKVVVVRRGTKETVLHIEVRQPGASAKRIAAAAQAATDDLWIVPYSIVVDGDRVGVRVKDGDSFAETSVLERVPQPQTEILMQSTVASR